MPVVLSVMTPLAAATPDMISRPLEVSVIA